MDKKKRKQTQWGIIMAIGLFILVGTVGHIELGGDMLPNIFKGILGSVVSIWGLVKTIQWTPLED